jgi:hypothetical protein
MCCGHVNSKATATGARKSFNSVNKLNIATCPICNSILKKLNRYNGRRVTKSISCTNKNCPSYK